MAKIEYDIFGTDPLLRLSPGAYKLIQDGACVITAKDAMSIYFLADGRVKRLSEVIEKRKHATVAACLIEESVHKPTKTVVALRREARDEAFGLEEKINHVFDTDPTEWVLRFGELHGWHDTIDLREVIDAWNEAKSAWETFRDTANELSGVNRGG